ncbi:MAG: IS66 family insertion sequence element accessory protein TnpB [Acidobacteriota bacterium]
MINIGPQQRVLLAVEPVDFRRGIDGLAAICRQKLGAEPMSGVVFVFTNRRRTSLKLLQYEGQGMWLCQKRLSQGRFRWWPAPGDQASYALAALQLPVLLWNGGPLQTTLGELWRPLPSERLTSSSDPAAGPSRAESRPVWTQGRGRFLVER